MFTAGTWLELHVDLALGLTVRTWVINFLRTARCCVLRLILEKHWMSVSRSRENWIAVVRVEKRRPLGLMLEM